MEPFKGRIKGPHQCSNPNYTRAYDYNHIAVLMDPQPPPDQQEMMYVMREESRNCVDMTYMRRAEAASDTGHSLTLSEKQPDEINPSPVRLGSVQMWKRWASCSSAAIKGLLSGVTNDAIARIREWMEYISSRVQAINGPAWEVLPLYGPRWVVEISTQYVIHKGLLVVDTTECAFSSKESAEMYASHWNEQMGIEGYEIPYSLKILMKNDNQATPTEPAIA